MGQKKGMSRRKKERIAAISVVIVCILVILGVSAGMIRAFVVKKQAQKQYEEMRKQYTTTELPGQTGAEEENTENEGGQEGTEGGVHADIMKDIEPELLRKIDFAFMQQNENEDIYAWLSITDTNIDYPVVQHPTDNSYYLKHNLNKTEGYPAGIYTELENKKDFSDFHTVIYGHNMRDGSMFHDLRYFEEKEYLAQHPYLYIYTQDSVYQYEIFAAYEYTDDHLLHDFSYDTELGRQIYIEQIRNYTAIKEDVVLTPESHILTLSTCISDKPDKRLLVQGVLVE